jgi:hypothetical protein
MAAAGDGFVLDYLDVWQATRWELRGLIPQCLSERSEPIFEANCLFDATRLQHGALLSIVRPPIWAVSQIEILPDLKRSSARSASTS